MSTELQPKPGAEDTRPRISQRELRNDSGAVLRRVAEQGEELVVTVRGVPKARLVPMETGRKSQLPIGQPATERFDPRTFKRVSLPPGVDMMAILDELREERI